MKKIKFGISKPLSLILVLFASSVFAKDLAVFPKGDPSDEFLYTLKNAMVKVSSATKSGAHGYGTGIAISKDHVVTNCHVIYGSQGISVSRWGEAFAPSALQADWEHDLCILRFEWVNFSAVPVGESEALQYEQPVISISMPHDSPAPFVTLGKIKALYPMDGAHVIRATNQFSIGASGSPVFDYQGNLIAISTFKSPGKNAYFYNMPAKWIKALLQTPEVKINGQHELPFWDAPDEKRPFFMRVVLPYQNEKWDELKVVSDEWLAKEPNGTEALFYAAVVAERFNDPKKAKTYFEQVLNLQPQHSGALIELGLMANKTGDTASVEKTRVALQAIDVGLDEEFTEALKK
jgi:serine protease Do